MANISPTEKLARLQEKAKEAELAVKEQEQRRIRIAGKAMVDEMRESEEFRAVAREILKRRVKRPGERADIAVLLIDPPNGQLDIEL